VNGELPIFPAASIAVHVTVVWAIGKVDPDGGVHDTGTEPSTSSNADAENDTNAPLGPVAGTVIADGTVTTGGRMSSASDKGAPTRMSRLTATITPTFRVTAAPRR
jgi:hypothetical protein